MLQTLISSYITEILEKDLQTTRTKIIIFHKIVLSPVGLSGDCIPAYFLPTSIVTIFLVLSRDIVSQIPINCEYYLQHCDPVN